MGRTRRRQTTLSAPYLRRVRLDRTLVEDWEAYPFCLRVQGRVRSQLRVRCDHAGVMREFCDDPRGFVEATLGE